MSLIIRQTKAGEVSTSARAITHEDIRLLWLYNEKFEPLSFGTKLEAYNNEVAYPIWGSGRLRTMMQCIYILSFLCLLRFDEVLKIQLHHIKIENKETCEISLYLVFRKTK